MDKLTKKRDICIGLEDNVSNLPVFKWIVIFWNWRRRLRQVMVFREVWSISVVSDFGYVLCGDLFFIHKEISIWFPFDVIIWRFQPMDNSKLLFKHWFFPVVNLSLRGRFLLGQLRARQKWPPGSTPFLGVYL